MGIETAIIIGAIAAAGATTATSISSSKASKKQSRQAQEATTARERELAAEKKKDKEATLAATKAAQGRLTRRSALLETGPQGVLETATTGRQKLFGN